MKITISSFTDRGVLEKERLVLKVSQNTDIGDYILLRTSINDGEPTSGKKDAFWFPWQEVNEGDLVVVYSKSGKTSSKQLENGRMAYFYYWGFSTPQWSNNNFGAVLLNAPDWVSKNSDEP